MTWFFIHPVKAFFDYLLIWLVVWLCGQPFPCLSILVLIMSFDHEAAAAGILDKVMADESPIDITGYVKASKNGVLTIATALVQLWGEHKRLKSKLTQLDSSDPISSDSVTPLKESSLKVPTSPNRPLAGNDRAEETKVCRDAWKGRKCSSPSKCTRIHPSLCLDLNCPGKGSCNLFHGRKKSHNSVEPKPDQNPSKQVKQPVKSPNKHQGNGKVGTRHPNKKAVPSMLPVFSTREGEEFYLRYRLAELDQPCSRSYRDVVATPKSHVQQRGALLPFPSSEKLHPLQEATTPAAHIFALPALSDAVQQGVTAALKRAGLL